MHGWPITYYCDYYYLNVQVNDFVARSIVQPVKDHGDFEVPPECPESFFEVLDRMQPDRSKQLVVAEWLLTGISPKWDLDAEVERWLKKVCRERQRGGGLGRE